MTKLIRNHAHWGAFLAEVEDGRVVGVRPFEHDPHPSPMIQAVPGAVHSPTRIVQPMVREGWLKHGRGHGEGRGREAFVPVSWERALDLVAGELVRIKSDHGHDAIMAGSQGWGSAGIFHEARSQLRRFMSTFGGFIDQTSNYSFGTALTFLPHVVGSAQSVTGPLTSWSSIARHAKLMALFGGCNPKNMQVTKGGCAVHSNGDRLAELVRNGVDIVRARTARTAPLALRRNGLRSGPVAIQQCCSRWSIHLSPMACTILTSSRAIAPASSACAPTSWVRLTASRRMPTGPRPSPGFRPTLSVRLPAAWQRTAR